MFNVKLVRLFASKDWLDVNFVLVSKQTSRALFHSVLANSKGFDLCNIFSLKFFRCYYDINKYITC